MFSEDQLPIALGGAYTLTRLIGGGGMAVVYAADVDLERFDYALTVAFGETPLADGGDERETRRRRRYEAWRQRSSPDELRALCARYRMPLPTDGAAAIKIMLPHLARQREPLLRFEAEWQTLMAIGSPHLVQVYGGGHVALHDVHYYAMELLREPLSAAALYNLPLADKLAVAAQAAAGLAELHRFGVVHRDVKPANLLVALDNRGRRVVKVADLGLAKTFGRELTESGSLFGTMYYLAPELLRGSRTATPAADVYSLGATLYHLIAGAPPYMGYSELEVIGKLHAHHPPQPLSELCEDLPPAVERLVQQMMATAIEERPETMARVVDALRHCHLSLPAEQRSAMRLALPSRPAEDRVAPTRYFDHELGIEPVVTGEVPLLDIRDLRPMSDSQEIELELPSTRPPVMRDTREIAASQDRTTSSSVSRAPTDRRGLHRWLFATLTAIALALLLAVAYVASNRGEDTERDEQREIAPPPLLDSG